jgi:hypothetical protein
MTVNSGAEAILRGRVVDTQGKNVMVRFPPDLYVKALKKQSRMTRPPTKATRRISQFMVSCWTL